MAAQQVDASYQNDVKFAELDLQDVTVMGPRFRIETFRCSQPVGQYGLTAAGTSVEDICGADHLLPESNTVFRSIDSISREESQVVIFEIRESITPSGSFHVRARDVDAQSESFGHVVLCTVTQQQIIGITSHAKLESPTTHLRAA